MSMFAFTRQEQRFVLFLIGTFLIGLGTGYFRKARLAKQKSDWYASDSMMISEFRQRAQQYPDSLSVESQEIASVSKAVERITVSKAKLVGKININSAGEEELTALPRIGPAMARRIVEYRDREGMFKTAEEIKKIKGIGDATFEKIKNHITVRPDTL
jgi:comEA protein